MHFFLYHIFTLYHNNNSLLANMTITTQINELITANKSPISNNIHVMYKQNYENVYLHLFHHNLDILNSLS